MRMAATDSANVGGLAAKLGLDPSRLPRHIAVIMDGNGRWAQERGKPRIEGHAQGMQAVRRTVEDCCNLGIDCLTLYCFSSENWKRPKPELDFLMALLEQYLIEERELIMQQNIRLRVIGSRDQLPEGVLREVDKSLALSRHNTGLTLALAINYGARQELLQAIRRLAERVAGGELAPSQIDEPTLEQELFTHGLPEPDLLIRTAGEQRLSNFLLWQLSYTELWFTERCWPDFDTDLLALALRDYAHRVRRFGGLK
jgi:undecaprenyl diphosphate synthase